MKTEITVQELIDQLERLKTYHSPCCKVCIDIPSEYGFIPPNGYLMVTGAYTFDENEIGLEVE